MTSNKKGCPMVTVVIPTISSRAKEVIRAKLSVSRQTWDNVELLIISDDSITASEARNKGICQAKGKYIAFLDDDDEWDKDKLALQVGYMEKNPDCVLCTSYSWDKRFGMSRCVMPMTDPTFKDLIKSFNLSSTSSYMVRKDALVNYGIHFRPSLVSGQEFDLAIHLSLVGKIHCIERVLMLQNATEGQISCNWFKKVKGQIQFLQYWHGHFAPIDYVKTLGLLALFTLGYIVGVKIYALITVAKKVYEK